MSTNSSENDLQKLSDRAVQTLIPVIVILCLYSLCGILGNPFVLIFYGVKAKKTPSFIFIVCLAVFDLIVCCVSIPMELIDLIEFYTFPNAGACKFLRFINYFATMTSGLFLLAIAADRYRKICRPLQKQVSDKLAKILVVVIIFGGLFLAWPSFVFYTVVSVNVTSGDGSILLGSDCKTLEDDSYQLYVTVYHGILFLVFIVSTTALTVIYSLVVRQLLRTKNRFRSVHDKDKLASPKSPTISHSGDSDTTFNFSTTGNDTDLNGLKEKQDNASTETSPHNQSLAINSLQTWKKEDKMDSKNAKYEKRHTKNSRSTKKKETFTIHTRKYTFIAIAITVGFVLSFLPYLIIFLWLTVTEINVATELSTAEFILVELGVRTWIINSVVNPFIYGFFNTKFREFVFKTIHGIFCCRICRSESNYGVNDHTWMSFSVSPKSTTNTEH